MGSEEIARYVRQAQAGDLKAFNGLMRQFQDQAVSYATSILGNPTLGQDAAQEAFVEAHRLLPTLRSPETFPAWFRKIIFKQCNRLTRSKQIRTVPLQWVEHLPSSQPGVAEIVEQRHTQEEIHQRIQSLPEAQRVVVALFYLGEQSHQDIADFLDLPLTTVKSRLHQGRAQMKGKMITVENENFADTRPSRNDAFVSRVNGSIIQALASVAEQGSENSPYMDPHPVFSLQESLIMWAIEAKAAQMQLHPKRGEVQVSLHGGPSPAPLLSLPKSLHEPTIVRMKVSADLDVTQSSVPQSGTFPILYSDVLYDASVSTRPTQFGESMVVRLVRRK